MQKFAVEKKPQVYPAFIPNISAFQFGSFFFQKKKNLKPATSAFYSSRRKHIVKYIFFVLKDFFLFVFLIQWI